MKKCTRWVSLSEPPQRHVELEQCLSACLRHTVNRFDRSQHGAWGCLHVPHEHQCKVCGGGCTGRVRVSSAHLHLISTKAYKNLLRRTFCAPWNKYILNDYASDYKARLTKLHLLPLSMLFELHHICFFIKSLKYPDANSSSFNIVNFVSFNTNQTRSGSHMKLVQPLSKHSRDKQVYFNRLPSLWNSLLAIDLTLSYKLIKRRLKVTLWNHFLANFNPESTYSFHYSCPCSKCSTIPRTVFTSL